MDQPNRPVWRVAEVPTQFRLPGVEQSLVLDEARYTSADGRLRYSVLPDGRVELIENVAAPAADLLQEILQNFGAADAYHQHEQEAQGPHPEHPFQQAQEGRWPYPLQQEPGANLEHPVQQAQAINAEYPHEHVQPEDVQVGLGVAPQPYHQPGDYQNQGFVNDAADINLEYNQQVHGALGAREEIVALAPNGFAVFEAYEWREQDHDGGLEEDSDDEASDDDGSDGEGDDDMEDGVYEGDED